jgi:hypothetical protein
MSAVVRKRSGPPRSLAGGKSPFHHQSGRDGAPTAFEDAIFHGRTLPYGSGHHLPRSDFRPTWNVWGAAFEGSADHLAQAGFPVVIRFAMILPYVPVVPSFQAEFAEQRDIRFLGS